MQIRVTQNQDRSLVSTTEDGGHVAEVGEILEVGDVAAGANIDPETAEIAIATGRAEPVESKRKRSTAE